MSTVEFSDAVREKGRRYAADGAVSPHPHYSDLWRVTGSRMRPYTVRVLTDPADESRLTSVTCDCTYGANNGQQRFMACSHVAAVLMVLKSR